MRPDQRQKTAERVSTIFGPVPMGVLLGIAVGVHSGRGLLAGAGWGLLSVACAAVLPAVATAPLRRREGRTPGLRLAYMTPAIAGATVGLAVLWLLPAPADVRVLALGFAAGLVSSAVVNVLYAASNHVAAVAGGVVLATSLIAPALALTALIVPAVAWARVAEARHTWSQAWSGAIIGIAASTLVLVSLR